jgi:hypothetical protein
MGTTRTTTAMTTITFTEDQLNPYVAHAPARRRLTGPRSRPLPGDGALMTIEALRTGAPAPVADGRGETESVLFDGVTGEIATTYFFHDRLDRLDVMDAAPLAPALEKLLRCATAVDELTALRGQFACYAARLGRQAVAEASRRLSAVFEAGAEGRAGAGALWWKLAAVIRPLALVTGPVTASGLALDLPVRLLDEEFGSARVVRFEDVDVPAALTHAPTRRFLRATGLPEEAAPFSLEPDMPLRTLAEHRADGWADEEAAARTDVGNRLPAHADRLIRLGGLADGTSLVVDGATGAVLCWSESDLTLRPLNADISTLAFTLWLLRDDQSLNALHDLTDAYGRLADTLSRGLAATEPADIVAPVACDATPADPAEA